MLKHVQLHGDLPCCADTGSFAGGRRHSFVLFLSLFSRDAVVQLASKLASSLMLETWNVGLVRMNFRALLAGAPLSDVTLLPRLKLGHYIADPFILSTTPELTLLVEDYTDFGVGRISEMTVRDPFGTPEVGLKVRLESKHHMSYPFLFREEGVTYCLPECHQSNASLLYRYDAGKLTPLTDLVPGARATDGTILFHQGLYWLFCGLEDDNDQVNLQSVLLGNPTRQLVGPPAQSGQDRCALIPPGGTRHRARRRAVPPSTGLLQVIRLWTLSQPHRPPDRHPLRGNRRYFTSARGDISVLQGSAHALVQGRPDGDRREVPSDRRRATAGPGSASDEAHEPQSVLRHAMGFAA